MDERFEVIRRCMDEIAQVRRQLVEAQKELERLQAVVEAAREIVTLADTPQLARNWATDRLRDALAAYEQAKGEGSE